MEFTKIERPQTLGEEIANAVSHGAGLLLLIPGLVIIANSESVNSSSRLGAIIFASFACILYLSSLLYHALPRNRAKDLFRIIDHSAIYLLIAATYTPFTLGPLKGYWGTTLLVIVWSLALLGIVLKSVKGVGNETISTAIYLLMGWSILICARTAWATIPEAALTFLVLGGVAYSAGVIFFIYERIKYFHFLWHLSVIAGTACHFLAILWYT